MEFCKGGSYSSHTQFIKNIQIKYLFIGLNNSWLCHTIQFFHHKPKCIQGYLSTVKHVGLYIQVESFHIWIDGIRSMWFVYTIYKVFLYWGGLKSGFDCIYQYLMVFTQPSLLCPMCCISWSLHNHICCVPCVVWINSLSASPNRILSNKQCQQLDFERWSPSFIWCNCVIKTLSWKFVHSNFFSNINTVIISYRVQCRW